ncbi:MAG: DNA repair protein RecO [Planctomycetes bacterium RBG_13_60_9]|nr:MAG: DNA repair protein RecO [Planctomycetes bacterium RBG_13_60_9]
MGASAHEDTARMAVLREQATMLTKDRAVCIQAVDYSETSQVVTLFARLSGKVRAIAKGSKRPKSPFDGPIEVLSFGDVVFSDSGKDRLATLTEFQQQPVRGELRRSLFALHSGLFAAELLNSLTDEYDPHLVLFDHFIRFLQDIEEGKVGGERRDILIRVILFQLVLLHEVGLRPIFNACANCKRPFGADWRESYFSASANGLICRDCEMSFPDKIRLSTKAVNCLTDVKRIANADDKTLDEIERVLMRHFTGILGHRPRMAEYIQEG